VELLRTERLSLRQLEPGDAEVIGAYRSDPEIARYQSWNAPYPIDAARTLVREMSDRQLALAGWTQIGIEVRATGELVGDIAFERRDRRQAAVGYSLARAHWGNGYATEAVGAVVAHGLEGLGLDEVVAEVLPENVASVAVLTRLGFVRDGALTDGEDVYVRRRSPAGPRSTR
jgi:RimJ/RimL family protein N-acetyltransferase